MKDALNSKINDFCKYVTLAVKNFKEENFADSALNARKSAESACKVIIYNAFNLKIAEDKMKGKSLKELIYQLIKDGLAERKAINTIESLQIIGNKAAHDNPISKAEAAYTLNALSLLTDHLFDEHLKISKPTALTFDFEPAKEVERIAPQLIKEVIIQEKIIREKINQEKEDELFLKIKQIEQKAESEKGKYEDLKNELNKAKQELQRFLEAKHENELLQQSNAATANTLRKKRKVKILMAAFMLIIVFAIALRYTVSKKEPEVIPEDLPLVKSGDTLYVALNTLNILQDNPNIDFKIESVIQEFITSKQKSTELPVKVIVTHFYTKGITADSLIINKAFSLGYDVIYFGKLYETALADSNEIHIDGYMTNPEFRIHRSKKVKFKSLSDSVLIRELNDQANMPFIFYDNEHPNAVPEKKRIASLENLTYYSPENYAAGLSVIINKQIYSNNLDEALKNTNTVLSYYPQSIEYLLIKANIFSFTKRFDSSEVYFKKLLQLDSLNPTLYLYYSDMYLEQGKLDQTEEMAKRALQLNAKDFKVYFLLAYASFNKKDYAKAKAYSLSSFKLNKNYSKNTLLLAESYSALDNKFDSAAYYYNLCIGKDSTDVAALNGLASLYRDVPKHKQTAVYLFNKARQLSNENNVRNDYGLGMNAFEKGQYDQAIKFLERVYAVHKNNIPVLTNLSLSHLQLKNPEPKNREKALFYAKAALLTDSSDFFAVYIYAYTLWRLCPKEDKAINHYFELSKKIKPDDLEMILYYLEYLYKKGDYKAIIKICTEKQFSETHIVKIKEFLANGYAGIGDYKNAAPLFEYLNVRKPDNDSIMFQLAQCYLYSSVPRDMIFNKGFKLMERVLLYNPNGAYQNLVYARYLVYINPYFAYKYYQKAKNIDKTIVAPDLEKSLSTFIQNENTNGFKRVK